MVKIKKALISVSDKSGLDKFVRFLHEYGVEIISTGGTAKFIRDLGVPVRLVSELTESDEMLNGRVKTLHPKIHGALLALRDNKEHCEQVEKFGIELIDMVIVNLYPFEKTIADPKASMDEAIENIDIGGPSMLRSGAKNAKSVVVICNPERYEQIMNEMKKNGGAVNKSTCLELAAQVFELTNAYDKSIADYLRMKKPQERLNNTLPQKLTLEFEKVQTLRYGENPHQQAAFYKEKKCASLGIAAARQLHGKELSFNNILDLDAALNIVKDFRMPAVSIIKHNNPCGIAIAENVSQAYKDALACDPLSAFGSIVGVNRKVDQAAAEAVFSADFVECIIAPGFSPQALNMLRKKKNLRIMEVDDFTKTDFSDIGELDYKRITGGLLVEDKDKMSVYNEKVRVVTSKKPTEEQMRSLLFAQIVAKHVKSNAIVLAQGTKTVGIGAGQMSRVDSVIIAIRKAQNRTQGAVMASDAFFPQADSIQIAAKAGICAIIQPGGSIRDEEVLQAAEKAGISMVMTGVRHFKH
ncbi:MAG: bifunctional phosphoribosylaminoimidazolecarboxamide formyltransferase/IMP cyclohydrolase [Candidatus Omnitrophica bacterium]|nr:bifunctional phosphoribosylaminoimidazolecarboxamide formyltransferase/IMP cyclohydrolase [Candidatus Omnitrophota bacterium]